MWVSVGRSSRESGIGWSQGVAGYPYLPLPGDVWGWLMGVARQVPRALSGAAAPLPCCWPPSLGPGPSLLVWRPSDQHRSGWPTGGRAGWGVCGVAGPGPGRQTQTRGDLDFLWQLRVPGLRQLACVWGGWRPALGPPPRMEQTPCSWATFDLAREGLDGVTIVSDLALEVEMAGWAAAGGALGPPVHVL